MIKRLCTDCKKKLSISRFNKKESTKDGFSHQCKKCEKEKIIRKEINISVKKLKY